MEAHLDEIVLTARSSDRFENKYKFAREREHGTKMRMNRQTNWKLWNSDRSCRISRWQTATDQIKQQPHATTPAQAKITRSFAVWQSILHWAKIDSTIFLFSILISTIFIWRVSVCVCAREAFAFKYLFYFIGLSPVRRSILNQLIVAVCIAFSYFIIIANELLFLRWKVRAPHPREGMRSDSTAEWDLCCSRVLNAEECEGSAQNR